MGADLVTTQKAGGVRAGTNAPGWVAFDKVCLRFDAYFQESVNERRDENFRIRKCKILFYPEDDTIQVNETVTDNSGMPQGVLIRRGPMPKDGMVTTQVRQLRHHLSCGFLSSIPPHTRLVTYSTTYAT